MKKYFYIFALVLSAAMTLTSCYEFNNPEIFDKVKDIIVEQLSVDDPDSISPETSLTKDLEADSLYVVEVIMAIEEEFNIEIDDESAEKFNNVADIVDYVEANA